MINFPKDMFQSQGTTLQRVSIDDKLVKDKKAASLTLKFSIYMFPGKKEFKILKSEKPHPSRRPKWWSVARLTVHHMGRC